MKIRFTQAISNEHLILSLNEKLEQFIYRRVTEQQFLCITKHEGWSARAFYDGEFYDDNQEENLVMILKKYGYDHFFALPFLGDFPGQTDLSTSFYAQSRPEAIEELRLYGFCDWYIIIAGKPNLIILLAHQEDFMIVMGEHEIFDEICGYFPSETWTGLDEMANSDKMHPNLRRIYTNLINGLNSTYMSAKPGDILTIDLV